MNNSTDHNGSTIFQEVQLSVKSYSLTWYLWSTSKKIELFCKAVSWQWETEK